MADMGARPLEGITQLAQAGLSDELGLGRLIDVFRRRIWILALTAATVFLLVAFITVSATRLYTASAQVQIDTRERRVLGADVPAVMAGMAADTYVVETETEILGSRALAGRVVDSLNLVEDREFAPPPRPGLFEGVANLLRARPAPTASELAAQRMRTRELAINNLLHALRIGRVGLTYIINIQVTSTSAEKAAKIADSYAELYLTQQLETKYDTIARANEWLSNRLDALREEVLSKEREVAQYRSTNNLLEAEGSTLTEQGIADLNRELILARANLAEREARLRGVESNIRGGGQASAAAEALASPTISALRAQQAEVERTRAELSTKYGPKHPEMQRVSRESGDIAQRIEDEVGRIVSALRNEVQIARNRVDSIEGSLGAQRSNLATNNVVSVRLRELERDAEASRTLYEAFLTRFRQIAEQSGLEQADARIVSRATPPLHPSSPNVMLNFILGLVIGVAAGIVMVFLLEILERSLRTPEDVSRKLGVTCLGAVPFLDKKSRMVDGELVTPENFVLKRPVSAFGEALRSLRASVFFANPDRRVRVLAVTSALPDEGKTTSAIGLARISALAGSKTVLVDCDLRRRSATHSLGIECEKGLTEVLFRTATLNEVIKRDPASGVDVVPLAQAEFTPRDLFGSEAMHQLIEQLKLRYEVVIMDTAPVLPLADTRVLSPLADAVLLIVRWGRTPATLVKEAIDHIKTHGGRIAGVALEGVETSLFARLVYDRTDYYSELYQTYYLR